MASPEIYRQQSNELGKWWRYLAAGVAAFVILTAVVDAIDLRIPPIQVPQI